MFSENIASSLILTINGQEYTIAGGNIKQCTLKLRADGFSGDIEFCCSNEVSDDKLIDDFISDDLVSMELTLAQHSFSEAKPGEAITLKGLVGQRDVAEEQYLAVNDSPILYRRYRCQFFDVAQFIWQQHFPSELYVDKSLKEVLQAQIIEPIKLTMDWPPLDDSHPMICLGLGALEISFYQFLINYLAQQGGYLLYNYQQHSYKICAEKPEPAQEIKLAPEQVASARTVIAATDLQSINLLNGHVSLAAIDSVSENTRLPGGKEKGVKQDRLIIASLKQQAEQHKQREAAYQTTQPAQLSLELAAWPLKPIIPGIKVQLKHPLWNKKALAAQQGMRIFSSNIELKTLNPEPQQDLHMAFSQYQCHCFHQAEALDNKHWPRVARCLTPFLVQGIIVSEAGDEADKTYQYQHNDETKQNFYRVKIPLWDKEIQIHFQPDFLPPHFYFPLYQGTQVELEMTLFSARITQVLDWGARVFLEQDSQGNHLIFGKNDEDETRLKYDYQDNKPVFSLQRTKDKDTELVQLEEGKIIFRTQEQD